VENGDIKEDNVYRDEGRHRLSHVDDNRLKRYVRFSEENTGDTGE